MSVLDKCTTVHFVQHLCIFLQFCIIATVVKYFGRQACEHLELGVQFVQHLCNIFAILHRCHCIVVKYFGGQACRHLEICRLGKRGMARKPFSVVNHIWTQDGCECELYVSTRTHSGLSNQFTYAMHVTIAPTLQTAKRNQYILCYN